MPGLQTETYRSTAGTGNAFVAANLGEGKPINGIASRQNGIDRIFADDVLDFATRKVE